MEPGVQSIGAGGRGTGPGLGAGEEAKTGVQGGI